MFAVDAAQRLAVSCPSVSLNPSAATAFSEEILQRLSEDGFDMTAADRGMSGGDETLAQLREEFLNRNDLRDGADTEIVCKAATTEIADGSLIGRLLLALDD